MKREAEEELGDALADAGPGTKLPDWVLVMAAERREPAHKQLGRYLWVRFGKPGPSMSEDDGERAREFNDTRQNHRDRWISYAEDVISALEIMRRGELDLAAPIQDITSDLRLVVMKSLTYCKEKLFNRLEDPKLKAQAMAQLPRLTAAVRDLSKIEMDLRETDMAQWNGLTDEEKAESFLAALERWPQPNRVYLARRMAKLYPKECDIATGLGPL